MRFLILILISVSSLPTLACPLSYYAGPLIHSNVERVGGQITMPSNGVLRITATNLSGVKIKNMAGDAVTFTLVRGKRPFSEGWLIRPEGITIGDVLYVDVDRSDSLKVKVVAPIDPKMPTRLPPPVKEQGRGRTYFGFEQASPEHLLTADAVGLVDSSDFLDQANITVLTPRVPAFTNHNYAIVSVHARDGRLLGYVQPNGHVATSQINENEYFVQYTDWTGKTFHTRHVSPRDGCRTSVAFLLTCFLIFFLCLCRRFVAKRMFV